MGYFESPALKRKRVKQPVPVCGKARKKYREAVMAVNMLTKMPRPRVRANPRTSDVPNQYKITEVIRLETLESRMEVQARRKPSAIAVSSDLPERSSSFILSKIKIFASTAIPIERINPAMPADERVTGIDLNRSKVK